MINVVNLSGYDIPRAKETKQKDWVGYGEDNNYYQYLIDQYLQSATNNAAIRSISDLIYGQGICIEGLEKDSEEVLALRELVHHRDLKKVILERKMLGQAAMQVIYDKEGNKRKVVKIKHFPIHTLRPEKMDEEGVINNYFYHPNWAEIRPNDELKKIPAFGTSKEKIEIFVLKPYVSGFSYFAPVDYSGALPYCELENEIADYLLNETKNSFSGTKVINFNNGIPDAEQRDLIARDVKAKLTGSRGEKLIVAFNENAESKTTVEDITLNDAPEHYSYLADEARNKILVGHRITSPMLLGIREGSKGLGNNSDEIMTASQLFNSTVISVYQDEICEAIEEVLEVNGEVPQLYFMTSQPIEFAQDEEKYKEAEDAEVIEDAAEEQTEEQSNNKETNLSANFNSEEQTEWLSYLSKKGEAIDENEWVLVDAEIDDDETEDEDWEGLLNHQMSVALSTAAPADKRAEASVQDTKWLKVRYAYVERHKTPRKTQAKRAFCRAMESAKRLYRKEDIIKMEADGVNRVLGHGQQPYSIWKHKGGVNCTHVWERRIYVKREKLDGSAWGGGAMNGVRKVSVGEAARKYGFDPKRRKFKNDKRVAEAQIDRADKGHHPNYFRK